MDSMSEQAALAARASRGTHWRLNEKLSEGEIELPENIPIRMWILGFAAGWNRKTEEQRSPKG